MFEVSDLTSTTHQKSLIALLHRNNEPCSPTKWFSIHWQWRNYIEANEAAASVGGGVAQCSMTTVHVRACATRCHSNKHIRLRPSQSLTSHDHTRKANISLPVPFSVGSTLNTYFRLIRMWGETVNSTMLCFENSGSYLESETLECLVTDGLYTSK